MDPRSDRRTAAATLMVTLGLLTAPALAQLDPGVTYATGLQPDGVDVGDFDGDGIPDIATTADQCAGCDDVAILLGNPDGTFAAPFYVALPNSSSPGDVVAGDLDGDGDVDLAVGLTDFNQVIVVTNLGGAAFSLGATASTGIEPRGMDIGDADADGDLDVVVANRDGNNATFLRNNGSASFTSTTLNGGVDNREAAFGDFDGDGDLDIAVSSHDDRTVRVFRNDGASFSASATLSVGAQHRPEGIECGDLNGDGLADIATAVGDDETAAQNGAITFIASSASSFSGPQFFFSGPNALNTGDIAIGDLDCDGDLDLATAAELSNTVSTLFNGGGGSFGAATVLAAGSNPDAIVIAGLEADGDMDIVASNRNSNDATVYLNHCDDGGGEPVCGNGICEPGEDEMNCPDDCGGGGPVCGNGICEPGEDATNCPGDCGGGGGPGDFTFAGNTQIVGLQPSSTAGGDFDGDGDVDLAVVADQCGGCDDVAILMGNGDGTFGAPIFVPLPISSSPEAVVAGDLDGDGDVDLAVSLKDTNQVIVVTNTGAGSFTPGATAPTGVEPRHMDIGDADGDGDLDIVVANRTGNTITFLMNSGTATFASTTMAAGTEPRFAVWGDFDGDKDLDAAVSNHDDRTVGVYTNSGGSFALSTTLSVGGLDRPDGLDTGDLDGDGLDDIATASGDDTEQFNRVIVFRATGAVTFTGPAFYPAGPGTLDTSAVVLADLDCDGDLDAATANQTSNNVSVLANDGTGVLGTAVLFGAGTAPDAITALDLDGSGGPDLVTSNRNSNDITILLNTTESCDAPGIPGDANGDGLVNVQDLVQIIQSWGPCPGCPADFDGDGMVGVSDLIIAISNWS